MKYTCIGACESRIAMHACELRRGSESHLPRLPPNARCAARSKRRLQKLLLVSARHPLTRLYLRSRAAIAFEKRRHGVSAHWWLVHPCSCFRFAWDIVMSLAYLYMFFMIPHMMSFHRMPAGGDGSDPLAETLSVLTPGYVVCLVDVSLNFLTGYVSPDGHEIFLDPLLVSKLASHYASGRFFALDLLSSIPYTWFHREQLQKPEKDPKLRLLFLELLPLLKFFRLSTLRHYIKEVVVACGASRVYEHGIWILCLTVLIFHWAACFTFVFPFFYAYVTRTPLDKAEGYLFNTKLYEKPTWLIYLTSLHMGGGNLCSYSYTEFRYTDLPDKVTRCILLLFGMSYFLYVIVIVLQLVRSAAEPELKYQSIMHGVKDYIGNKKLSNNLKDKLLHFYEHRFQGSLFKEKAITSTLSKHLKHEITQHSSRILLESSPLLNSIPRSLLNSIIGALKQVIFLQDDVIFKCDTEGKCMYFIVTGTVAIISYSGKEICHLRDGDYFGEIALVQQDHKRITTAIALEMCEVLRFDRRDFNRVITPKSDLHERLELVAHRRMQDVQDVQSEI
ncbi:potassium/sodium hyperpolarization-activated cyclic nucleotide-gated channel 3-like isoform X1 [Nasonia vitripennis]|uniref:Cyclic nucleotide-binding domain-containing protein n=2 Tax=Nasonia vitripennis TaxID=7425 RepID=A0A7M7QPF6_NASVI|nr:potassium/sodium hyperpolarization-activated cyclic nucleotide-gated channel 3-like isoform X1 [Nasonia vitripennis]